MYTFSDVAMKLNRNGTEVRTLVLARKIPSGRVGRAYTVDERGFKALERAFEDLDREAEARGMLAPAVHGVPGAGT